MLCAWWMNFEWQKEGNVGIFFRPCPNQSGTIPWMWALWDVRLMWEGFGNTGNQDAGWLGSQWCVVCQYPDGPRGVETIAGSEAGMRRGSNVLAGKEERQESLLGRDDAAPIAWQDWGVGWKTDFGAWLLVPNFFNSGNVRFFLLRKTRLSY